MTIQSVVITANAAKELEKVPYYIVEKLLSWVLLIEMKGIFEVRKIPGYHDEPLKGVRNGERSIRLSRAYRAIYRIVQVNWREVIHVEEIHKHDY